MSLRVVVILFAVSCTPTLLASAENSNPAPWAYPVLDPTVKPPPDDGTKRVLPGSNATFTSGELGDLFATHDWFPDAHPAMPEVVAHGRKPEVRACGMCHLPNGQGRPENAGLAGLPAAYIVQQMADFKSGRRRSSVPTIGPQIRMVETAANAIDDEVRAAALYFARQPYRPWTRVEADTVPTTQVVWGWMSAPSPGGGTEPIGHRIVEIPEDLARTKLRDPRSGFVAYVPKGSIALGQTLVMLGGEKTQACATCHGPDLRGIDPAPPIAGKVGRPTSCGSCTISRQAPGTGQMPR